MHLSDLSAIWSTILRRVLVTVGRWVMIWLIWFIWLISIGTAWWLIIIMVVINLASLIVYFFIGKHRAIEWAVHVLITTQWPQLIQFISSSIVNESFALQAKHDINVTNVTDHIKQSWKWFMKRLPRWVRGIVRLVVGRLWVNDVINNLPESDGTIDEQKHKLRDYLDTQLTERLDGLESHGGSIILAVMIIVHIGLIITVGWFG